MTGPAPRESIAQIGGGEQGGGRDHDGTELHRSQQGFPHRNDVGKHDDEAIAAAHPLATEEIGHLIRARRQRGKAHLGVATLIRDHP